MPFTTGVRGKIAAIILFSTLASAIAVSTYVAAFIHTGLMEDAEKEAMIAISRSANMFMVSTVKFQKQLEEAKTPEAKNEVREDWVRTIVAVDDAVVHDFGADTLRVRLIGDTTIANQAPLGGKVTAVERPFERDALTAFVKGRKAPFSLIEDNVLRIAVPLTSDIHAGCANCHDVPVGERRVLGTLNAYIPLAEAKAMMWRNVAKTAAVLTVIVGGVMAGLYLAINRLVLRRVKAIGDDLATLPEVGSRGLGGDGADELQTMAHAITVLKDNLSRAKALEAAQVNERLARQQRAERIEQFIRDFDRNVASVLGSLGDSVRRMHDDAQMLAANAEQTSKQSTAVAAAATQASINVQTVAVSTQELTGSIGEIGRQVSESAEIANAAVEEATRTNTTVSGLSDAAQKIGEVVELINSIASQTNLLALNATIEAARAGEAGKGFAVVAGEVKNLANQTAKATGDIQIQVQQIQAVASQTVAAIQGIGITIGRMREITTCIATAVEEQGAATQEIARNINQASSGTSEVSDNISGVTRAAGETGAMATDTLKAADILAKQSETLRREVDGFIQRVRTA